MSLDLMEAPAYAQQIENKPPLIPFPDKFKTYDNTSEIAKSILEKEYFINFKKDVNKILGEVKAQHLDEETSAHIELLFDTIFAPLRLADPEVEELHKSSNKEDIARFKTISARLQHSLAHALFYAMSGNASSVFTENMQLVVKMYENLSRISPNKIGGWYKGVCGHTGGYLALYKWGCQQFPPSYLVDPLSYSDNPDELYVPLNQSEVYESDIKRYFDDAVLKDGHLFLFDFKGAEYGNGNIYEYMPAEPYGVAKRDLPRYLVQALTLDEDPRVVQRVTLVIPKRYTNMTEMFSSFSQPDVMVPGFYETLEGLIENARR